MHVKYLTHFVIAKRKENKDDKGTRQPMTVTNLFCNRNLI